ncbi:leucyl aminopeptidase [Nocardioides piscis]|uniref:Probable cytosol aminopeptidase n=1 Tax=Nocardioides piscis TaxID=2714938 RepID=A0A6G7YKZ8_9ACTN|nr:leucyl aminopeptidase [Nocardioides piscis]
MTTTYTLRNASPAKTRAEAVVVGVSSTPTGPVVCEAGSDVAAAWGRKWLPMLSSLGFTGKPGESVRIPTASTINAPLLVLVGLGPVDETDETAVRRAAGVAARSVPNAVSVAIALPADTPQLVDAVTQGHLLGGYTFTRHKSAAPSDTSALDVVVLSPIARKTDATEAFERAQVVAAAVRQTREWVNEPPGHLTPAAFAEAVTAAHKDVTKGRGAPKVALEIWDHDELTSRGLGGTLAVGNGSDAKPRLARLAYSPKGARTHLALVGKGITFDSGGLSIKPAGSMTGMKADMAGAACVVTATLAIARLGLPIKVTAWAPMAENMVSGSAFRPSDVVTMYGGKTVEVTNTDAEGRMLLGDALVLAVEEKPDLVVDIATLTGHMMLALGDRVGAVMGSADIVDAVLAAGTRAGEQHWPMPIPEEMKERVGASKIADLLQHDGVRWGGGLMAAAFLREFTDGLPWAHLDIAGKELNSGGPYGHVPTGATGFGVTTLVELARTLAEG